MLAGQIVSKGSLLLTMMLLARYLDDKSFGILSFAVAIGLVYMFISELGVSVTVNMTVSLSTDGSVRNLPSVAGGLRVLLSAAGLVTLASIYLLFTKSLWELLVMVPIAVSYSLDGYSEIPFAVFRASGRLGRESLARSLGGLSSIAAAVLIVQADLGLPAVALLFVLRSSVTLIVALVLQGDTGFGRLPVFDPSGMMSLLRKSLPVGVMGLSLAAFQRVDNLFVREALGIEAVGAWQECVRILDTAVLLITPTLLPGALFPGLCRALEKGGDAARLRMRDIGSVVLGAGVTVAALLIASGSGLLASLWGGSFARGLRPDAVDATYTIVCLAVPILFWINFLVAALIASRRSSTATVSALAGLVLLSAMLLLLLPRMGLPGAAVAILASSALLAVMLMLGFERNIVSGLVSSVPPVIPGASLAFLSTIVLRHIGAPWPVLGIAAGAASASAWMAFDGRKTLARL